MKNPKRLSPPVKSVARPLALFAGAFAAACFVFGYFAMPGRLYVAAGLAVVLALALILARQYRAHASVAVIAFIAGIAWSFAFAAIISPHAAELTFAVPEKIAAAIGDSINRVFPARLSPFLRALTIADAKDLTHDTAIYTALSMSGIAHIASVSGMHVSFLVSMLGFFARGRRLRVIVCIPVLLLFMAVTGFNPPVCRAVIMSFFVFIAPLVKRRSDGVTAVLASLLLILVVNPLLIAKISLQLSFLSTLGIVTVTPRIKRALDGRAPRRRVPRRAYNFVAESFAASVGALVFSMPLIAYYFGYVSLLAPVTNLLTVWAASFAFCGSLIAALLGLLAEPVGVAAAYIAAVPADWIFIAARAVAKIPFAAVYVSNVYILAWLAYTYAVFAAFFLARSPMRKIIFPACGTALTLCLALLLTAFTPRGGLSVTAIDVGQGQSLVISDGAATAVIDCGGAYSSVAANTSAFLQAEADEDVELLILTHFHYDHAGGVVELMTRVRVGTLVVPPSDGSDLAAEILDYANARGTDIITVTDKTRFAFGGASVTVFPPFGGDDNEACLTILVTDRTWDALITGDMPAKTELLLLEYADLPDIELFVAGHHGSRTSSSADLLDEVRPEIALISVGADNSYGHPTPEVLERFDARGIKTYRTDLLGNITVKAG